MTYEQGVPLTQPMGDLEDPAIQLRDALPASPPQAALGSLASFDM